MKPYAPNSTSLVELIKKIERHNDKQFDKNATIDIEHVPEFNMWQVEVFDGTHYATVYMATGWFTELTPEPYNMQLGHLYIYGCNHPTDAISWQYREYEVDKPSEPKPQGTMTLYDDYDE